MLVKTGQYCINPNKDNLPFFQWGHQGKKLFCTNKLISLGLELLIIVIFIIIYLKIHWQWTSVDSEPVLITLGSPFPYIFAAIISLSYYPMFYILWATEQGSSSVSNSHYCSAQVLTILSSNSQNIGVSITFLILSKLFFLGPKSKLKL
jgi:hypothetical protein